MGGETGLVQNLGLAAVMALACLAIHFAGLALLVRAVRHWRTRGVPSLVRQATTMAIVLFGLLAIHSLEIWTYAGLYLSLGEFREVETALYFSLSSYCATGYGDLVLDARWRILGATESTIGLLMLGWSIAFMVTTVSHLRLFADDHHDPKS
jgi:hypothetical protein